MVGSRPEQDYRREGTRFGEYQVSFEAAYSPISGDDQQFFFNDEGASGALTVYSDLELPEGWRANLEQIPVRLGGTDYLDNWRFYEDPEAGSYAMQSADTYPVEEPRRPRIGGFRGRLADWLDPESAQARFTVEVYEDIAEDHDVPWAESAVRISPAGLMRHDGPYIATTATLESLLSLQVWHDNLEHPTEFFDPIERSPEAQH